MNVYFYLTNPRNVLQLNCKKALPKRLA